MYWDDAVIFGLSAIVLVIVFMAGWVGFVVHDHRRKNRSQDVSGKPTAGKSYESN